MISSSDIRSFPSFKALLAEQRTDLYKNSPFYHYKILSSKKKGKYFELLFEDYMRSKGYEVQRSKNSNFDRIIDNKRIEVKGSLLWENGTHFRWQQLRPNQDYDYIVFIAIYPDKAEFFYCDKETLRQNVEIQDEDGNWPFNQHGGKTINSGTFFIDGFPEDFSWLLPLSGLFPNA
jgi:hypothetical protein